MKVFTGCWLKQAGRVMHLPKPRAARKVSRNIILYELSLFKLLKTAAL
jgi:hypothetical protein